MPGKEAFMDLLDLSTVKKGDVINLLNTDKSLFSGTIVREYKGCLALAVSIKQENYRRLNKNEAFELIYASKDKATRCSSVVIGSSFNNDFQILLITTPKVIAAIERRQFKRLQTVIDIDYCFLPEKNTYERISKVEPIWLKKMKRSFTVDISAGGISLITYEKQTKEKQAVVSFNLNGEKILALCNVVRIEEISKNKKTAMKYVDIKKEHVQLIDSYVLEKTKEV